MNKVELIRAHIVDSQRRAIIRLRQYVSMTDNNAVLPLLEAKKAEKLVADLTDHILNSLGHKVVPAKDGRTQTRRTT